MNFWNEHMLPFSCSPNNRQEKNKTHVKTEKTLAAHPTTTKKPELGNKWNEWLMITIILKLLPLAKHCSKHLNASFCSSKQTSKVDIKGLIFKNIFINLFLCMCIYVYMSHVCLVHMKYRRGLQITRD